MDLTLAASLPILIWAIFIGALLLSISLGALLTYHWLRYAMNRGVSLTALLIYGGVTFFLLSSLFAATVAISFAL